MRFLSLFVAFFLVACSHEPKLSNADIITVKADALTNTLYFNGVIQPMNMTVLSSPVDGAVVDLGFQYGDLVKQSQPLFYLSSSKFVADYKAALLDYVKAKNEFDQSKTQMNESAFLHKNLLISDDDYAAKKSAYFSSQLSFMQAKDALAVFLTAMNMKEINLYDLTIADIDKIKQAMQLQEADNRITLSAPASGVILSPIKSDGESNQKFEKGDAVKQGDTLAMIGDMQGVSVKFKVNEMTINQIKPGQLATISGVAFPDEVLQGKVSKVDEQANNSSGESPTFDVEVIAPMNANQQKLIHPGMSANVSLTLTDPVRIHIPIQAIIENNAQTSVTIVDPQTHALKQVTVLTGKTTPTEVEILSGLSGGERLVVPH